MKKLIFIISFLFVTLLLSATNYYVKTGGSDAANGLTDGTAWLTLNKVNNSSFSPGDLILLNRGNTWNEDLHLNQSGISNTSQIIVDAYGNGNLPLINMLWFDANAIQFITVNNIHCRQTGGDNALYGLCFKQVHDITIQGCVLDPNGHTGCDVIDIGGLVGAYTYNLIFRNCTFIGNGTDFGAFNISEYSRDILVENCTAYNGYEFNYQVYSNEASSVDYNITFRGCTGYNSVRVGAGGGGINIGWHTYNSTVEGCYFYGNADCGISLDANTHDVTIKNNITYNNHAEMVVAGSSYGNIIVNNTFVAGATTIRVVEFREHTTPDLAANIFKNNILVSIQSWWNNLWISTAPLVSDYNCFFNTITLNLQSGVTVYTTLADWITATGQDAHSISINPLLTSDFHLQSISPAKDAGLDVGLTTDFAGHSVPQNLLYDIGAYEYGTWVLMNGGKVMTSGGLRLTITQ